MRTKTILIASLAACLFPIATGNAKADELYKFVAIRCTKEIGQFSLETFQVVNSPHDWFSRRTRQAWLKSIKELRDRRGIFVLHDLNRKPFECMISGSLIRVEVTWYKPARAKGFCGAQVDANLRITIDGKKPINVVSTHGLCRTVNRHYVSITATRARHCMTTIEGKAKSTLDWGLQKFETTCTQRGWPTKFN